MDMQLIVETGQGVPDADSYNSISELDIYMEKFGYRPEWPISEESIDPDAPIPDTKANDPEIQILRKKQAAARKAAVYIDSTYGIRFPGTPKNPNQGLAWPRIDAVDYNGDAIADDIIPSTIKKAHAEVALLVYKGTKLFQETSVGPLLKRKKIDTLEWEWDVETYTESPIFGWVDQLLVPLLGPVEQIGALDVFGVERA